MITFSRLICAARELEGYRLIPLRAEVMKDTGDRCKCGSCYCCRMGRFVRRIRKADEVREERERQEIAAKFSKKVLT